MKIALCVFALLLFMSSGALAFDAKHHQLKLEGLQTEQKMYNLNPNVKRDDGYNRYLDTEIQREQREVNRALIREQQQRQGGGWNAPSLSARGNYPKR